MSGRFKRLIAAYVFACILLVPTGAFAARIKDITTIKGIRSNQLFGYGLVIGLNGSGDKSGGFTVQGLVNMLERIGIHVDPNDVKVRNVAAVMVNATLPAFARIGKKIDVTLSSIGDAKSLEGGTLLLTPLTGVDGKVYALAQGPIAIGGFSIGGGSGSMVTKNHPTVGRITDGATVEKEIPIDIGSKEELTILLNHSDFNTASRVARVINRQYGNGMARPVDSGSLTFRVPPAFQNRVVEIIAQIGNLEVEPDTVARIIVNEKTGTVVIGENVRIQQVAIAHGNLSIEVKESASVSQPAPFAPGPGRGNAAMTDGQGTIVAPGGATVVTPESEISVTEEKNRLILMEKGNSIRELINALNAIGVTPRDLITILQALKAAGALQGELVIL